MKSIGHEDIAFRLHVEYQIHQVFCEEGYIECFGYPPPNGAVPWIVLTTDKPKGDDYWIMCSEDMAQWKECHEGNCDCTVQFKTHEFVVYGPKGHSDRYHEKLAVLVEMEMKVYGWLEWRSQ